MARGSRSAATDNGQAAGAFALGSDPFSKMVSRFLEEKTAPMIAELRARLFAKVVGECPPEFRERCLARGLDMDERDAADAWLAFCECVTSASAKELDQHGD